MGKKKKEEQKELEEKALQGAAGEAVQRFGSAVREHVAAYTGKDNGVARTKGLKSISESRVNTDYAFQNLHQQAGFSAEVKEVANRNAESIIKSGQMILGESTTRSQIMCNWMHLAMKSRVAQRK